MKYIPAAYQQAITDVWNENNKFHDIEATGLVDHRHFLNWGSAPDKKRSAATLMFRKEFSRVWSLGESEKSSFSRVFVRI